MRHFVYLGILFLVLIVLAVGTRPSVIDREALQEWCRNVSRETPEVYKVVRDGYVYAVANTEIELMPDGSTRNTDGTAHRDGFFVIPPGKWVDTPQEVLNFVELMKLD